MNNNIKNNTESPDIKLLLITIVLSAIVVILFGILLGGWQNPVEKVMTGIQDGFTTEDDSYTDLDTDGESAIDTDGESTVNGPEDTTAAVDTPKDTVISESVTENGDPDETTTVMDTTTVKDTTTAKKTTAAKDTTSPKDTAASTTGQITPSPHPVDDPDYFKDALFIGDSRTVGLYLYGKISGAKYFGKTSASVYNLFNTKKSETGTGDYSLEEYLKKNKFGKIYILLGINEIGGSASSIASKYKSDVQRISELQPGAIILIQSNMHVTKAKSDKSPKTFNNTRIDALNKKLSQIADNERIFYLDFVSIFDDETGNMDPTYSRDGIHLKAKSYSLWKNWLLEYGKR